ncbi:MAG: sulfurtransferase [Corynebacterium sp.]|uniref:sulfurtransferase n=1 Tax=Corynebacterium sp. TaxID=1720 RepID=UPI0026DD9763|nr:sulfurtransferase [Corynebacterium sp.]MDO4762402.1 sulfurtransferase [Corynebacterium sp.]
MPAPFDPHPLLQEYAHPGRLVSASWLSARLGTPGLRVVESDEDALLYDIGHIPGAVRIDWKRDLNDPLSRDFISAEEFAQLMRAKGIGVDDTVVIYGDKSNWWAAFTLWVFELFGHKDVRLLNGGRDAWMAEERDTSYVVPEYPATDYPVPERNDAPFRAFVTDVQSVVSGETKATIIDARDPDDYAGTRLADAPESGVLRHGHIPGAVNISWEKSVHPNSRFRSREELEKAYAPASESGSTIVYCSHGHLAAHTWFVLKYLLGRENVRNYDGSWAEWGNMVRMDIRRGHAPDDLEMSKNWPVG